MITIEKRRNTCVGVGVRARKGRDTHTHTHTYTHVHIHVMVPLVLYCCLYAIPSPMISVVITEQLSQIAYNVST